MFGRLKHLSNLKTERNSNLGSAFNEGEGVIHGSECTIPISTQKKLQSLGACVVMMERPASFLKKNNKCGDDHTRLRSSCASDKQPKL